MVGYSILTHKNMLWVLMRHCCGYSLKVEFHLSRVDRKTVASQMVVFPNT